MGELGFCCHTCTWDWVTCFNWGIFSKAKRLSSLELLLVTNKSTLAALVNVLTLPRTPFKKRLAKKNRWAKAHGECILSILTSYELS